MYTTQTTSPLIAKSVNHHVAAAEHHEEAAESHRLAAAHYSYGDYQQANQQAKLAREYGEQAGKDCLKAME